MSCAKRHLCQMDLQIEEIIKNDTVFRRVDVEGFGKYYLSERGQIYDSERDVIAPTKPYLTAVHVFDERERKAGWSPPVSIIQTGFIVAQLWVPIPRACDMYESRNIVACMKAQASSGTTTDAEDWNLVPVKKWQKAPLFVQNEAPTEKYSLCQILKQTCQSLTYIQLAKAEKRVSADGTYIDQRGQVWNKI